MLIPIILVLGAGAFGVYYLSTYNRKEDKKVLKKPGTVSLYKYARDDYVVIPEYPFVRRGIIYSRPYMKRKIQTNTSIYPTHTRKIHFIEPDRYRKRNILALRS